MTKDQLIAEIKRLIKANGNQEITGDILQNTLVQMINFSENSVDNRLKKSIYSISTKHNDLDNILFLEGEKILIKKGGFRLFTNSGETLRINKNKNGFEGEDLEFSLEGFSFKSTTQFLVLNLDVFKNNIAWINDTNLFEIIDSLDLKENQVIISGWYSGLIDPNIGLFRKSFYLTNRDVEIIPLFSGRDSFNFINSENGVNSTDLVVILDSFFLLYGGVNYKIRFDSKKNFEIPKNSGFLISLDLNLDNILKDMSLDFDEESLRYLNINDDNIQKYLKINSRLSSTKKSPEVSNGGVSKEGVFNFENNISIFSIYKNRIIGGLCYKYFERFNINNFRDKQYFIMSEMDILTDVGLKLNGNKLTVSHFMFYEFDFATRETNYYQIFSDEAIDINLKEGDTVVIDISLLYRNGRTKISLDTGEEPISGTTPALKVVRYGEYNNTQLPIVQKRSARVYEHPAFSNIFLKGQMELLGKMLFIPSHPDAFSYEENKLLFKLNQALFIYADSPYKSGTNYMRINIDISSIALADFDTLVIDTTKITWNSDSVTINYLSEVTKTVNGPNYLNTDIPIAHYRHGGLSLYPIFASYRIPNSNNDSNLYSINKTEFLPYYFSVQETKFNGWKKRLNLLHISDIHIGSEDADTNLKESVKIAKEPNIGLSAIVGTGDLTVGFQGAVAKENTLLQLKSCSEIVKDSPIVPLLQLGNHDANDADRVKATATTKAEQWDNMFSPIADKWTNIIWGDRENNRHYNYLDIDHTLGNVRIIMLDQLDNDLQTDANGQLIYSCQQDVVYSQKQIDWLCNVALQVPENTGVIICNHFGFMERSSSQNPTTLLVDGQFVQGWQLVPDIVQAWQNRTSLAKEYKDIRSETQNINVNVDFSGIDGQSEFITYLCGHTHYRTYEPVSGYNQLLIMEDSSGQRGNLFSRFVRVKKTPTSNAFSILSIDRSTGQIYRTSYGAYKDYDQVNNERIEIINYKL